MQAVIMGAYSNQKAIQLWKDFVCPLGREGSGHYHTLDCGEAADCVLILLNVHQIEESWLLSLLSQIIRQLPSYVVERAMSVLLLI